MQSPSQKRVALFLVACLNSFFLQFTLLFCISIVVTILNTVAVLSFAVLLLIEVSKRRPQLSDPKWFFHLKDLSSVLWVATSILAIVYTVMDVKLLKTEQWINNANQVPLDFLRDPTHLMGQSSMYVLTDGKENMEVSRRGEAILAAGEPSYIIQPLGKHNETVALFLYRSSVPDIIEGQVVNLFEADQGYVVAFLRLSQPVPLVPCLVYRPLDKHSEQQTWEIVRWIYFTFFALFIMAITTEDWYATSYLQANEYIHPLAEGYGAANEHPRPLVEGCGAAEAVGDVEGAQ